MSDWRTVPLGSLLEIPVRAGIYVPKSQRGRGVPLINMGQLFAHDRIGEPPMERVPIPAASEHKFLVRVGDLLMARLSLKLDGVGKVALVEEASTARTWDGSIFRLRFRPDRADARFFYYYFRSHWGRVQLLSLVQQTAAAGIRGTELARLEVPSPPLRVQRVIAESLSALDDKIELNRRMKVTLESTARALFKSWFVDFDVVRGKAEGRRLGRPPTSFNHFPERLQPSSLGLIPDGWLVTELGNELTVLETGSRPAGGVSSYATGTPSIGAESIVGLGVFDFAKTKYVPHGYFAAMRRGKIASRDVLLYKDGGRPGEFEPHVAMFGDGFPFAEAAINEHVYRLRTRRPIGQNYLFFWLSSHLVMDEMRLRGTGVAVPGLNSTQVRSLPLLIPPRHVLDAFDAAVEPVVAQILRSARESVTLARIRDALLPRLISGEIHVPAVAEPLAASSA